MSWAAGHHVYYIHKVMPNICGSSACNCVHDILWCPEFFFELAPNFWKICATVIYVKSMVLQDIVLEEYVLSVHSVEECKTM